MKMRDWHIMEGDDHNERMEEVQNRMSGYHIEQVVGILEQCTTDGLIESFIIDSKSNVIINLPCTVHNIELTMEFNL